MLANPDLRRVTVAASASYPTAFAALSAVTALATVNLVRMRRVRV